MSKGKQSLTPAQNERLAVALEELKKRHGTDAAVGALIGRDQGNVSRVRRREQGGSMELAEGVARALGVDVATLLGIAGAPGRPIGERPEFATVLAEARASYVTDAPPAWAWDRVGETVLPSEEPLRPLALYHLARAVEASGRRA